MTNTVTFDNEIIRIFGRAMGFSGVRLEAFIVDYSGNLTRLFTHSAIEHLGEIMDPDDMEKLLELTDEIAGGETDDLEELGTFLGEMVVSYPQAREKIDKEISDFNEGILGDFLSRAPKKYITELLTYLDTTFKKNKRVGEMIDEIKAQQQKK